METSTLESYDSELVRCIQVLKAKREEVHQQILREEEDKTKVQRELKVLTERLQRLNESLAMKTQTRLEYDRTVAETEAAYAKVSREILESAQTLAHVLKRESTQLEKRSSTIGAASEPYSSSPQRGRRLLGDYSAARRDSPSYTEDNPY